MDNPLLGLVNLEMDEKVRLGAVYTPSEIANQISIWKDTYSRVKEKIKNIKSFILEFMKTKNPYIIFTGAGTSEFIGLCLVPIYTKYFNIPCFVCPSPELVVCPENYLIHGYTPLLISFARSGNSPESTGALKFVNEICQEARNIIITCNKDGRLFKDATKMPNALTILLNEKANDRGLAMTSSFTNLLIAGQGIAYYNNPAKYEKKLKYLTSIGNYILEKSALKAEEFSKKDFYRAVFLGSGPHFGTAKESALKLQELTSGKVMCTYETFVGFRHGPESIVDNNTLVVSYLSADAYRARYEIELLNELKSKDLGATILVVGEESKLNELSRITEHLIEYKQPEETVEDEILPPAFIITAQLLGLYKSLSLGLKPDSPSVTGAIHRVVRGVRIYDYFAYKNKGDFKIVAER